MLTTLIISDLHLTHVEGDKVKFFNKFCNTHASKADQLFILGDLFNTWLGDDVSISSYKEVISTLKKLTEETKVFVMAGNRDFLLSNNFENEIKKAAEVLISACTNSPKQLEAMSAELESLYEKMDRFEGSRVDSLKKAIKPFLSKELNATYRVHPQAIIDRRFDFQEKKILATLRLVSSIYPEQYAIYGAGALGRSLLKGFDSIGFLPAYMVDRNPDGCGLMPSNVPVITLSEAKAKGISNFLISSYSYYDSILSDIRAVYGNDFNVL